MIKIEIDSRSLNSHKSLTKTKVVKQPSIPVIHEAVAQFKSLISEAEDVYVGLLDPKTK